MHFATIHIEERAGRGRCVIAARALAPGTEISALSGAPYAVVQICLRTGSADARRAFAEDLSGRRTSRYRRRPDFSSSSMPLLVFWPHAGAWGAGVILPPCAQLLWCE